MLSILLICKDYQYQCKGFAEDAVSWALPSAGAYHYNPST